ncbi:MAG: ABC transporter substrate-binding protein [Coriobacteriaceae bacterium]|jgi:peptide/nickel transport system substrate-binding protein|nr:ABC transporter substrate-binding protein [Coriobacteriaceae bacterium]
MMSDRLENKEKPKCSIQEAEEQGSKQSMNGGNGLSALCDSAFKGEQHNDMPPSHMSRRAFVGLGAAAALAAMTGLSLAGCGGSGPAKGNGTVLRVGVVSLSDADALDPAKASTPGGYIFANQVFDTLTEFDTTGAWAVRLAESIKQGETADTWTIVLKDAKWHNDKPVTAQDVVYTVKRWFDEKLPPAESLSYIKADAIKALDEKTVEFKLSQEVVMFPEALASPLCGIVPQGFDPKNPVGSGPFLYDTVDAGVQMTFKAFDGYWGTVAQAEELMITSFTDTNAEANALLAGQIDVAANFDSTLVSLIEGAEGYEIFDYPTSGALSWAMNCEKKPFDDPIVRSALRLAVNRQEIIDNVYGGFATLGNDYWSPYDPNYTKGLAQRSYDPAKAKKMLEDTGYTLPLKIELWGAPNQPTSDRQNEILVEQAKAAGFEVEFHKVDMATFYGDAYGTYPLSLSYWGYLSVFDQAAMTITKDAPYNSTHWTDREYDGLYTEAVGTTDAAKRKELVKQMQTIEYERGSYIVPLFMNTLVAHSAKVGGFKPYPNTDGAIGYNFNLLTIS